MTLGFQKIEKGFRTVNSRLISCEGPTHMIRRPTVITIVGYIVSMDSITTTPNLILRFPIEVLQTTLSLV